MDEHRGSKPHMVYRDDGTGCRRCGNFHPDCSPCPQSPEDAALDRKPVLDAYRENMAEAAEPYGEHRGSRPFDRDFAAAAASDFAPANEDQAVALQEKAGGRR